MRQNRRARDRVRLIVAERPTHAQCVAALRDMLREEWTLFQAMHGDTDPTSFVEAALTELERLLPRGTYALTAEKLANWVAVVTCRECGFISPHCWIITSTLDDISETCSAKNTKNRRGR